MDKQRIDFKEIRELAKRFTSEEMETCISQQLYEGVNECKIGPADHVLNELSKAGFVRKKMDEGVKMIDAIRELAERIRKVQQGFD
ncbi:hypothetical protein MCHI_002727 [Candidatus Magnetoovum chiemensis]|nr:hypothetical protein MCHI_002727 [Candidatus Magnetoovum chiemensis]